MPQIYLDNASTSFPKPPTVAAAVYQYMTEMGSNINRGSYDGAYAVADAVFNARRLLCDFFGAEDAKNVVFTKNVTEAINIIIKGLLQPGDHVLVSAMEHNAVMRPLQLLGRELAADEEAPQNAITFSRIPCDEEGNLLTEYLSKLVRKNTKAVIMTHGSNVCGTLLPIEEVGKFCRKNNLFFVVDSAQTAGVFPIDMQRMYIDAVAFTGHKSLLGPQGIGGFVLAEKIIDKIKPLIVGGTGSISHTENTPRFMPDKFEAGTLNLPGIIGLAAGVRWLQEQGMKKLREHELALTQQFLSGVEVYEARGLLKIIGKKNCCRRTGVVSLALTKGDNALAAQLLAQKYGIAMRVGLHCAPNAHKTLRTYPAGTLRFSFGWHNTPQDVQAALSALGEIVAQTQSAD